MKLEEFFEIVDAIVPDENGCLIWTGFICSGYPVLGRNCAVRGNRLVLERKLGRKILPKLCALHTCDNQLCLNSDHIYEGTQQQNMDDMRARGRDIRGDQSWARKYPEKVQRGETHWSRRHPEKLENIPRGEKHWAKMHPEKVLRGVAHFNYGRRGAPGPKGEKHRAAKLTAGKVLVIRELVKTIPQADLARIYHVHVMSINDIVHGRTWKHLLPGAEQSRTG